MKQKLVIVNNGLKDHRGHYFETSIAIAEAARRAGLHPVLATHVDCRTDLLPTWLETYPIFCTDHWVSEPPAEPPDLAGLNLDLYAADIPQAGDLTRYGRRAWWACRKAFWCADRAVFYLLPPLFHDGVSWLAKTAWRLGVPRILNREYHPRICARAQQIVHRLMKSDSPPPAGFTPCTPEIARSLKHPQERRLTDAALDFLKQHDLVGELENALIFKRDLERLLALSAVGPGDHVLLGTAHARETLAVQWIIKRLGPARAPTFHLEFRHALFSGDPTNEELETSRNIRTQRAFLTAYEQAGASEKIRFYTDTEELARDYGRISKLPFQVLPIPFRSELISTPRMPSQALRLVFIGEARDEKGFHWLPKLIDRLMDEYVRPGRVRFLLQANVSAPQYNPQSQQIVDKLRAYPSEQVELFGVDAPLSPEEYYSLVSRADVVLLPYDRDRYRACSSGTLAEALAGGRPAIVPACSWMSAQIPLGAGETFHDFESFVQSVQRIIDNYAEYRSKAEANRTAWLSDHSPERLIARITGATTEITTQALAA